MSADFLLELLCEEIPARMQATARNDLARMLAQELDAVGIGADAIDVWSTPRRLALIARGLPSETQAGREEIKGPRTSAPPQALEGFLRKTGLTREQLEERDGVLFAVVERAGQPTRDLLGPMVERIVRAFPWPKSMRWGGGSLRWVRPLHGIVALLGEHIVGIEIDGIVSGATTVGHRFHHAGPITIGSSQDYAEKLRACHVIVDHEEREKLIRTGAEKAAGDAGLTLVCDEGLVVENAGLTEWPVPLLGRFHAGYLDVPREVIVLTMRTNQKYFACTDESGALAPAFVCVANVDGSDGGEAIVAGNHRVLAARLADARFFWEQDLKVPLEKQTDKLSGIVFHEKLGTVADKVERVAAFARWLAQQGIVKGADPDKAERAARLAKADLVTGMVGEFPELQGVIGGYLARAQGEHDDVAEAIRDHYKPAGQGYEVPTAPLTVALALGDKLDTLIGFFATGVFPTGSRDPYALRRSALGAMHLVLRNDVRLDLDEFLSNNIGDHFTPLPDPSRPTPEVVDLQELARDPNVRVEHQPGRTNVWRGDVLLMSLAGEFESVDEYYDYTESVWDGYERLMDFLAERMRVSLTESGHRFDIVNAAMSARRVFSPEGLRNYEYDVVRLLARVKALHALIESETGADLLTAYKRAANILKKEKWEPTEIAGGGDFAGEEAALVRALEAMESQASMAVEREDFTGAMRALAQLRGPIDAFFDHVTVNDPDPGKRERRLNLLARFRDAVQRVADFSKIEG